MPTHPLIRAEAAARKAIFDHVGYKEDWAIFPIDDATDYVWKLHQEKRGDGEVRFADTVEDLNGDGSKSYSNDIYTQRHLPKWVYRGKDFTMIVVDTHTDGNKFLQLFDNAKEQR